MWLSQGKSKISSHPVSGVDERIDKKIGVINLFHRGTVPSHFGSNRMKWGSRGTGVN
jgi:hypothetical protein